MDNKVIANLFRKAVHVALVTLAMLPLLRPELLKPLPLNLEEFYAIALIVAAAVNSVQVKKKLLGREFLTRLSEARERLMKEFYRYSNKPSIKELLFAVERSMRRFDNFLIRQLELVERDYERRGGYLGLTLGATGIMTSYVLFGKYSLYGMISLAVTDPIANVVGESIGKLKLPGTNATLEGSLAGLAACFLALVVLGVDPLSSLLVAFVSSLAEAYGIEDNLTIPLLASLTSWWLRLGIPI